MRIICHLQICTLSNKSADGVMDHTYAVDFQVYKQGKLICAIQVKPILS